MSTRLLSRREAAEFLGVKAQTLATWHVTGRYNLPVVKVGRAARYRQEDLEKWVASRTVGGRAET
jgi:excisionase family DNA binding protein